MKEKKIKRRKFLKLMGFAAGGIFIFSFVRAIRADMSKSKDSPSKNLFRSVSKGSVTINKRKSPVYLSAANEDMNMEDAVAKAALAATDFSWLKKGQTVIIKPVINSGDPYPATTNPVAISAMIKLLKRKGAGKVIVGDMSGIERVRFFRDKITGSTRDLMEKAGILKAVAESGGEPYFFEEAGWDSFYKDRTDPEDFWKNGLMMPVILRSADHIVLMPRCSRHVIAGASLGLKAVVGYWRTDTKFEYHYHAESFHERTAEGNRAKTLLDKQRLVVSTGDKLLASYGPDNGYVYTPSCALVIASESVVAHDMVSLAWLLYNRTLLPAEEQGTLKDTSPTFGKLANIMVVKWLNGWGKAFSSETLLKNDLESIWDDRVLNHAYKVFGGVPHIQFVNVRNSVPLEVTEKLQNMTEYSQAALLSAG